MNRRGAETQRKEENAVFSSASLRLCGSTDWLLWQLADSAFPAGGFAHSGGLEAARQHREVCGGSELIEYLRTGLNQLAHNAMPFAHAAFSSGREFSEVDRLCDAFLSNHVANRASRAQGQAFLASVEKIFGNTEISAFRSGVLEQSLPGHFAPVFGRVVRLLGLDSDSAARLFVFVHLRGWISAAVRLNIVGPLEGQGIQHQLAGAAESVALRCGDVALEDAAQTAPLLDLWQGTQDRLYSRLFQT
ncbi:MAG TPA: urease accessory UreF family protein [Candidatus Limnocylindria bacterium]|nr:urease accessory UreF family protein [Candidatus Limnocylindria bacterium]